MNEKRLRVIASIGLVIGGVLGMAGTFAPSASLRGLAWGLDGVGLVVASALLTVYYLLSLLCSNYLWLGMGTPEDRRRESAWVLSQGITLVAVK